MNRIALAFTVTALSAGLVRVADADVAVQVSPTTRLSIGGVTDFEREKYITIHATPAEWDLSDEQIRYIEDVLEVSYGRNGGLQTGVLKKTPADPNDPDMPDVEYLKAEGAAMIERWAADQPRFKPESMREVVLCTHPEYMVGLEDNDFAEFGPRSPEAAAEFVAQFLKHYYTDETRPKYYEVFNEPFIKAKKLNTNVDVISEQHNITARRIKELTPDVLVGGYSAAWMELEARDFAHWNGWMKNFMDIAGDEMDFISYHLYDGVNVEGTPAVRTGSNTQAVMDMIDTYSHLKWGYAKPVLITEYGQIIKPKDNKNWPDRLRREGPIIRSFMGMLMTYMEHPDRLLKTVPFILGVGTWTYSNTGGMASTEEAPSDFLLYRRAGDNYVLTELALFYRFWAGVNGERRLIGADDPDIRGHYFADGLRHTLVLHNYDDESQAIDLAGFDGLDIAKVTRRSLQVHGEIPTLNEQALFGLPESMTLQPGETVALLLDLRHATDAERTLTRSRIYPTDYLAPIEAGEPIQVSFEDVPGGVGDGLLRVAIGRDQALSLRPKIHVNSRPVDVPDDWAGGLQRGRGMFYGVIEVPVPGRLLQGDVDVTIEFPDAGGRVATVVLQLDRVEDDRPT
ncbi:MAG: glycosyl hydrolase [Planctomycetota bacterium]